MRLQVHAGGWHALHPESDSRMRSAAAAAAWGDGIGIDVESSEAGSQHGEGADEGSGSEAGSQQGEGADEGHGSEAGSQQGEGADEGSGSELGDQHEGQGRSSSSEVSQSGGNSQQGVATSKAVGSAAEQGGVDGGSSPRSSLRSEVGDAGGNEEKPVIEEGARVAGGARGSQGAGRGQVDGQESSSGGEGGLAGGMVGRGPGPDGSASSCFSWDSKEGLLQLGSTASLELQDACRSSAQELHPLDLGSGAAQDRGGEEPGAGHEEVGDEERVSSGAGSGQGSLCGVAGEGSHAQEGAEMRPRAQDGVDGESYAQGSAAGSKAGGEEGGEGEGEGSVQWGSGAEAAASGEAAGAAAAAASNDEVEGAGGAAAAAADEVESAEGQAGEQLQRHAVYSAGAVGGLQQWEQEQRAGKKSSLHAGMEAG